MIPEVWFIKENIDIIYFIKIKNFCSLKDIDKRIKSHKLGELFVNYLSDKGLELQNIQNSIIKKQYKMGKLFFKTLYQRRYGGTFTHIHFW